jgi:hypothetical protein
VEQALRVLADPIERHRSAVVTTSEEVRGFLSSHRSEAEAADGPAAARLGAFAEGVIDVDRFSNMLTDAAPDDPGMLQKVEKAYDVLRVIAAGGDDVYRVKVKSGARLRDAVADRLAETGRAFAAARVAGKATAGNLNSGSAEKLLEPLGFERWTEAERSLAPPVIVELDGADLHAGDLAEFLDGNVKIVLLVNGEMAPAPLVRLITPSTFVAQTKSEKGLDRFAAFDGPAVAALVPEGAEFIHDPAAGKQPGDRLELISVPEQPPGATIGGMSVRQQSDELEQLKILAGASAAAADSEEASDAAAGPVATKVDKLAAWLLAQADLSDL